MPRRHEPDFFGLTNDEQTAILDLVRTVRDQLTASTDATGFNVGVNVGADDGQTVGHAHVHVSPVTRVTSPTPAEGWGGSFPTRRRTDKDVLVA